MPSQSNSSSAALLFIGQLIIALSIVASAWMLRERAPAVAAASAAKAAAPTAAAPAPEEPTEVANWARFVRPHNPIYGDANAPITIIEFSDFECPFCARHFTNTHKQLLDAYGDKIRIVYKHFPLPFHPNARQAAVASQCANREGKFWPLHDVMFENFRNLGDDKVLTFGAELGLGESWKACVAQGEAAPEVDMDMEDGRQAGVRGTPTFLVNGQVIPGAVPFDRFKAVIDKLL